MPYWKRAEATHTALGLIDRQYSGKLDFEVVLVDDGSHDFEASYPWLTILRLPKKELPKNPCVPINRGVKESKGEVIVLTNPEIRHNTPVLGKMLEELKDLGQNGYVLAACWYEAEQKWHCHSSITKDGWHGNTRQPKGSGFHFCAMLNRSLWDKAQGFDEEYRDGGYYDDPDWVNRVEKAGGVFRIRDDLVVEHVRDGCQPINWPDVGRNRDIFDRKWPS